MPTTLSFLFWNIRKALGTRFYESLERLTQRGVDVFLFAEPPDDDAKLLAALNGGLGGVYYRVPSESGRLMLFSKLSNADWADRFSGIVNGRITAHELILGDQPSLLMIGAHLHAPSHLDKEDRADWARDLGLDIRRIEGDAGHTRTVLVGDLNMNPFDGGLIATTALHGLMSRQLVRSVSRMRSRRAYPPFYNPMWSLLGDRSGPESASDRVAGTFFYSNSQARASHFWQMYDQILVRPSLMNTLTRLEILVSDGQHRLITRSGRPRAGTISDHLPLRFDLTLPDRGIT